MPSVEQWWLLRLENGWSEILAWRFESFLRRLPLKLNLAQHAPCKGEDVGSIPTKGFAVVAKWSSTCMVSKSMRVRVPSTAWRCGRAVYAFARKAKIGGFDSYQRLKQYTFIILLLIIYRVKGVMNYSSSSCILFSGVW